MQEDLEISVGRRVNFSCKLESPLTEVHVAFTSAYSLSAIVQSLTGYYLPYWRNLSRDGEHEGSLLSSNFCVSRLFISEEVDKGFNTVYPDSLMGKSEGCGKPGELNRQSYQMPEVSETITSS